MNNQITAIFDEWISRHYNRLKQKIETSHILDEDAFHVSYLKMRGVDGYKGDFESLFIKIYKQILAHEYSRRYKYVHPDPSFFINLRSDATGAEQEKEQPRTGGIKAKHIDDYVRYNYNPSDYMIFHLKYLQGMTYQGLIDYTGHSSATIARKLNNIKASIKQTFI